MRHRPRCWSREVTRRPHDAASPPLLVTRSDEEAARCGIARAAGHATVLVRPGERSETAAEEERFELPVRFRTAVFKKGELGERLGIGNAGDDAGFGPFNARGWQRDRVLFPPCYHEGGFILPRLALADREGGGRRALR